MKSTHNSKLKYKLYLESNHWLNVRKRVYSKQRKCFVCGRKAYLNIHHLTYKRVGKEREEDLVVLCRFCHTTYHKVDEEKKKLFDYINRKRSLSKKRRTKSQAKFSHKIRRKNKRFYSRCI